MDGLGMRAHLECKEDVCCVVVNYQMIYRTGGVVIHAYNVSDMVCTAATFISCCSVSWRLDIIMLDVQGFSRAAGWLTVMGRLDFDWAVYLVINAY